MDPTPRSWRQVLSTLKFRIAVASMLALALGIGATAAVLGWRTERDTLRLREGSELGEALRTARLLDGRLADFQRVLALGAVHLPGDALGSPARLEQTLRQRPVLLDTFDAVFVAGADGRMQLIHDDQGFRQPGIHIGDRPYFRAAMHEGQATVRALQVGRPTPEPVVVLAHPLRCGDRPCGVLAATLRVQRRDVLQRLTEADGADSEVQTVLSDGDGMILAHADPGRIGQRLSDDPIFATSWLRWRALREGASDNEFGGRRLSDTERLLVAVPVQGPGWIVWRRLPVHEVLAPLRAGRHDALWVASALVAGLGLAMLGALWALLRPLQRLQDRAAHLFDGQLPLEAGWPGAEGEIGRLEHVLRTVATERAALEERNATTTRQLQSVLAAAPAGLCLTRAQRFELVSPQFCVLFGAPEAKLLGQPARIIFAAQGAYEALGPRVGAAFAEGRPYDDEIEMVRADGERFWSRLRGLPVEAGNPAAGTIWTVHDISAEVDSRNALRWAAEHDPLTGLANRSAFDAAVAAAFGRRREGEAAALLLFDLDRFKPVNDQHGHAAGDAVLRAVADAARGCVRGADRVFRLGGDEFGVLLNACPEEAALRIAETLRAAVERLRVTWHGESLAVGSSIGVARASGAHASAAEWVAAADAACYAAKAAGRNAVRLAGAAPSLRLVSG